LWLIILPVGAVPVVYLLRKISLGAIVAALVAFLLAWLAVRLPTGIVFNLLGRSIELDPLSQVTLSLLFLTTAVLFVITPLCPPFSRAAVHSRIKGREEKIFYPVGLATLGLLVAASLSRHLGITAILIGAAAVLIVFIIQGERLDSTRAALRFLILMSLAIPLFLLAAWRIDLYQLSGGQVTSRALAQIVFFIGFGFALWLAMVPFHGWLTATAAESAPVTAAFVLTAVPIVAFSTLLHLLSELPWLIESASLVNAILVAGVFTALVGGGLASVQRGFGPLMGYAALYNLGGILAVLGLGGAAAPLTIVTALSVRALALTLLAVGASALRMQVAGDGFADVRGIARRLPGAVIALTIGGLTLTGAPLFAGFGPGWQLLGSIAPVNVAGAVAIVSGGLGVTIGYLRGLRAALLPVSKTHAGRLDRSPFISEEPLLLLLLIGLLGGVSLLWGLFPGLLIEWLEQWTTGVSIPIP
jgi:formate hydrogenlyase subunit 3/multisubunit Na+/H+ antiporter MnhD subunit